MSGAYDELPDTIDRAEVAEAVRDIVRSLIGESKCTYKALAKRVSLFMEGEIRDEAIRIFLTNQPRQRVNATNGTLKALYNFIVQDYHRFPGTTRALYFELREKLGLFAAPAVDDAIFAIGTHRWVHAGKQDINRVADKLEGRFIAIRRSTVNAKYIKSLVIVTRVRSRYHSGPNNYLKTEHYHFDRSRKPRIAEGFSFPIVRNIYMALQIEGHEGMEIILLREPLQKNPGFFMGFMFGLDANRNIYNSSVLLERLTPQSQRVWDQIANRFSRDNPRLAGLGRDFLDRLDQVIVEPTSQLLTRFDDDDED